MCILLLIITVCIWTIQALFTNSDGVTECSPHKTTVVSILRADYHIKSNTNLLVPCSIMSMTWLRRLWGIGARHCSTLKSHGRDWKREVSGCENHVRGAVERTETERESERKGETMSLVSCSRRPSCCSFHYSTATAWHWIDTAVGKQRYMRASGANIIVACAAKANKQS